MQLRGNKAKLSNVIGALLLLFGGCCLAQPASDQPPLAPAENLITEGIPPIPASIPVKVPGGARTQLTFFPDRVSGASYHPHAGDYFVFSKDIGGGEWYQLFRYDYASGETTLLTDGKSRNLGAVWSNRGDRLAYASTRRNRQDLDFYIMNPADKATDRLLAQNQGGGWQVADWSPDDKTILDENNRDLAFALNSARSPLDAYSINIKSRKLERWTTSETGGLNAQSFVEPELVKWRSFDGREISGWLYLPPAARFPGKRPVIVAIHGGPESQARPIYQGRNNYFLNEMGVAILYPNVRGSSGYGKTYVALDNGFKREDSYKDIEALLRWLKLQPNMDGDHIMVMGGSYGGHMTLVTATRYNDLITCSVDIVGMSSLVTFLEHTEPYRRDLRRVECGDERDPQMRAFLERIAPMNHVGDLKKPIFIVAGANDPRVPKSEADQMVTALHQQGTAVWYLAAKDEGHGFAKKKNADFQFYATILFVEKYLSRDN